MNTGILIANPHIYLEDEKVDVLVIAQHQVDRFCAWTEIKKDTDDIPSTDTFAMGLR